MCRQRLAVAVQCSCSHDSVCNSQSKSTQLKQLLNVPFFDNELFLNVAKDRSKSVHMFLELDCNCHTHSTSSTYGSTRHYCFSVFKSVTLDCVVSAKRAEVVKATIYLPTISEASLY